MRISEFKYVQNACPFCGKEEGIPFHTAHFAPGKIRWVQCPDDGLIYQNPRLDSGSVQALFGSTDYVQGENSESALGYYNYFQSEPALLATAGRKIKEIERKVVTKPLTILEIGCASGTFLKVCQDRGHRVEGIDVSTMLTEYGQTRYNLKIQTGFFENAEYQPGSFDVVAMFGSLVCLNDPLKVLRKINRILRPDGLFVFNAPVIDGWVAKLYQKKLWVYRPSGQVIYSKQTIKTLTRLAGFKVVRVKRDVQSVSFEKLALVSGLRALGRLTEPFRGLYLTLPLPSVYEFTVSPV